MKDQRKYVRIPESSQLFYQVILSDKVVECITKDISAGGIKFIAQEFIPHGSHLRIKVNFHKTSFSFEALVRWVWAREIPHSEEYEIGVEFIDIPQDAVKYLQQYIESLNETQK